MIGKGVDIGRAQTLQVPSHAVGNFHTRRLVSPLDMHGASRMMLFGLAGAQGKRIPPWQVGRRARGAKQAAYGSQMLYSPLGFGSL